MKRSFPCAMLAAFAMIAIAPASSVAATTIHVNSSTDAPLEGGSKTCKSTDASEDCTLRAAVELAGQDSNEASGEVVTVEVPAGTYTEAHEELQIEDDASIAIDGAGVGETIIEGPSTGDTVFFVNVDSALSLNGVTIRHGKRYDGGGVFVNDDASLTVESSAIEENEATEDGGGIYANWGSTVTIKKSSVDDNIAGDDDGEEEDGGGIFAAPFTSVVIEQSTIDGNKALTSGGGIYRVAIGEEDFCEGVATHRAKPRAHHDVVADEEEETDELTIKQSTIEGNTAEGGLGGGIDTQRFECERQETADGHPAVRPSTRRSWVPGAHASRESTRAALKTLRPASLADDAPEVFIERSTIAKNRAEEGDEGFSGLGGGIFEGEYFVDPIINSTIAENFASDDGGGVADESDLEELISDTVFGNTVAAPEGSADAKHKAHADTVVQEDGPGSNLAADSEQGEGAAILLRDTVVAEPKGSEADNCEGPIGSLFEGAGYNLDYPSDSLEESSIDTCGMSEEEQDLVGVEPQLSPEGLRENGGPTQTIALLSTSPAIGFVPLAENCEETEDGPGLIDQRGEHRPGIAGKGCDIGAYEYQEPPAKKEEPEPTPETKTTTTVTTPPAPPAPAAGVSPFKIQAPAMCASKRDIKIHIQNVAQFGIVSAVVSIDGKHKRTLKGRQLSTAIDLVGLPKGTFTIEIVAYTHSGHTLHGKRVYHTCHTKLPGRSYIPL